MKMKHNYVEMHFDINLGWLFACGLNAIPAFQKAGFPIGKHHFLQSGKRVQQTVVLDSPNAGQITCLRIPVHFHWISMLM